jgi:hypothetical protein
MATDLLKRSKKKAKAAPEKKGDKDMRVLPVSESLRAQVADLCEVATITGELNPLVEQRKTAVGDEFFKLWTAEMWDGKKLPENFRVVVPCSDRAMDDMSVNFILKFNLAPTTNGIAKKVPKPDDLPPKPGGKEDETMTVQEVIVQMLTADPIGMSEANAQKFVDEEVIVEDQITLAGGSFDKMYYGKDETQKKIASLWLGHSQARSEPEKQFPALVKAAKKNRALAKELASLLDGTAVVVEAFTDELEDELLVTKQIIKLKADLGARIYTYCESVEQLRGLLKLLAVTVQVSNFKFGISDEKPKRNERLLEAVCKYLVVTEDDEDE